MRTSYILVCLLLLGLGTGCATKIVQVQPTPMETMVALQQEIAKTVKLVQPGLIYAELNSGKNVSNMTALALSADGQILLPIELKKDASNRIQVWINEKEYEASLVQSDDRLKISIVKIEPETPLTPVNFADAYQVKPAQMIVGLNNSGINNDFKIYVDTGFARGLSDDGEYDELEVMGLASNKGSALINLDGAIIAWQIQNAGSGEYANSRADGWVISNEIQKSVSKLLAKAATDKENIAGEDEKEKTRPWLGFHWAPINEDYAELMGLPKKCIVVRHVIENSPLATAGLKDDDLVMEVDGKPFTKFGTRALEAQFVKFVSPELNKEITFKVLRLSASQAGGKEMLTVSAKFTNKPEPKEFRAEDIGVVVQNLSDADVYDRGLFVRSGVLVNSIVPGSPAGSIVGRSYVINRDDVIVELNKTPIKDITEFIAVVETIRREQLPVVLMKIAGSGGHTSYVALNLKSNSR